MEYTDIAIISGCESVALRGALGRVLARDVRSPLPIPGHANAAMDGHALRDADLPSAGTRGSRCWARRSRAGPSKAWWARGNACVAILRSMGEADCFIVLPPDWGRVEPSTLVDVQPFFGLV